MSENTIYNVFNYSVVNVLNYYLKTNIKEINSYIIQDGFIKKSDANIYLSSFTGDLQGSIAMVIDHNVLKHLTSTVLLNFSQGDKKIDVFDEVLNIIVSQFANALSYDNEYEDSKILHSPPVVLTGKIIQLKMFKGSHSFDFVLERGNIEFVIGLKK